MYDNTLENSVKLILQAYRNGDSDFASDLFNLIHSHDDRVFFAVIDLASKSDDVKPEPVYAIRLNFAGHDCEGKIQSIKAIRHVAGLGLREAKDASESFNPDVILGLTRGTKEEVEGKVNEYNMNASYHGVRYTSAFAVQVA